MSEPRCIRIEMEYDNGDVYRATGEDAVTIRKWMESDELMQHIHGEPYTGPQMKLVTRTEIVVGEGKDDETM